MNLADSYRILEPGMQAFRSASCSDRLIHCFNNCLCLLRPPRDK